MIRYIFLLLTILVFSVSHNTYGQYKPRTKKKQYYGNPRLHKPIYRWVTGSYRKHGLEFSFGPTYTFTPVKPLEGEMRVNTHTPTMDSTLNYSLETKGRLGAFAEIGMVHITKRPRKVIHYFDWGIGFKLLGGAEIARTTVYDSRDSILGVLDGQGEFYNGYLYGRFSMHSVFQMNEHLFLDNSLGFNVDYLAMPGNQVYDGYRPPIEQKFQGDVTAQLNYALGLGIKPNINKGFFIIPTIELPFFTAYEWNGGTPQFHWFSSKYYPAMVKLRLVWLFRKHPDDCPPVEINEDDKQRARDFQSR